MAFGWDDAALALLVVGDFVYHRWIQDHDAPPPPQPEAITMPVTQPGAPVPLVYGRIRVTAPILHWWGGQRTDPALGGGFVYSANMLWVIGIPFYNGETTLIGDSFELSCIYYGDVKIPFDFLSGVPGVAPGQLGSMTSPVADLDLSGFIAFYPGGASQNLAGLHIASIMEYGGWNPARIPGYRGYAIAMLHGLVVPDTQGFVFGTSPTLSPIHFEIQSLPATFLGPQRYITWEANPCDVIYDILTSNMGRYGMAPSRVHAPSFQAAAATLHAEGNGVSMSIQDGRSGAELINDILIQIDAVLYEDQATDSLHIKLIRGDFDPDTVLELREDLGVEELRDPTVGGWTNLPNRLRVTFPDREKDYNQNSVYGMGDATAAAGQDDGQAEQVIDLPFCCTLANAQQLADREVAQRFRPIAKCTAICDTRYANVKPGDVVAVTWPDYNWSRVLFRVAGVVQGAPPDMRVQLLLIQEFFQVYRGAHRGDLSYQSFHEELL